MHAVLEDNPAARSDCAILSLSWKGTVPDTEKDKSYTRKRCYTEGWLASGNVKGIVGATFTTSHCKKDFTVPSRTNFNLRGHNSEVVLVSWNEPFQKMATCDVNGVIFVWIKYEGRWSIELVNDRSCQVSDFGWSHDGRMALICYKDGFVLVGSVAGQRYWSSMLNLESKLLCGAWTPDDKQVLFGTSDGQIIVMDVHGAMVTQCTLAESREIHSITWSCEKFRMINVTDSDSEESHEKKRKSEGGKKRSRKKGNTMAIDLGDGLIQLMKAYDDLSPIIIRTHLTGIKLEWSNCGSMLAVGGTVPNSTTSVVKFYNINGYLRFLLNIPSQKPVSALAWGHNDQRLFIACGAVLHVAWIQRKMAPLQLLCRETIANIAKDEKFVSKLPLPSRIKDYVVERFSPTVKGCIPDPSKLKEFVSQSPPGNERLHCTMIRTGDDASSSSPCYTLFLEYLGGLVPLLKGKRISKLRPEFVIYDPTVTTSKTGGTEDENATASVSSSSSCSSVSEISDSENNESPKPSPRRRRKKHKKKKHKAKLKEPGRESPKLREKDGGNPYLEQLPEDNRLVEVTSNIWGTKFKIHGVPNYLPANLGAINYKTSLLHLQPRQMTIILPELRPDMNNQVDINFNASMFSEDEEDSPGSIVQDENSAQVTAESIAAAAPVAPVGSTNHSPTSPISRERLTNQIANFRLQDNDTDQRPDRTSGDVTEGAAKVDSQDSAGDSPKKVQEKSKFELQGAIPKTRKHRRKSGEQHKDKGQGSPCKKEPVQLYDNMIAIGYPNYDEEAVDGLEMNLPRWADSACRLLQNEQVSSQLDVSPDAAYLTAFGGESTLTPSANSVNNSHVTGLVLRESHGRSVSKSEKPALAEFARSHGTESADCGTPAKRRDSKERLGKTREKSPVTGNDGTRARFTKAKPGLLNRTESNKSGRQINDVGNVKCRKDDIAVRSKIVTAKLKSSKSADSSDSDGEGVSSDESPLTNRSRRKMKKLWNESCQTRVFVMHNKAPLWNENTQVYQLDFGGRVTQESAKNFQIELHGKQVMQFGRIDGMAYTLDFQYPFSTLQAFAVALANVTQRLK
ncbi:tubby-related protein 4-like [Ptychodera flava]|uniref:tubby-related protein 4-like n=1 Tax=Ptychodera flava TaxID=63121 RepID=UPI00396A57EA